MRAIHSFPLLFLLTACGPASPTWMPAGYSWHNDTYKAQPGPEARNLGYPYSPARNEHMVAVWADVARGLVNDMESQTGLSAQPVYIEKLPYTNAFNLSLDYALREELRARSYTLADNPAGNLHLRYWAHKPENKVKPGEPPKRLDPEQPQEFTFVLTLLRDNVVVNRVESTRSLPAYGFVANEKPEDPLQPPTEEELKAKQAMAPETNRGLNE